MNKFCPKERLQPPSVEDFCERTTWHGVSDFYRSRGWLRAFWGASMILATAASAYGCYAIIAQYVKSPVVISYMIHPADDGRFLPDVVVCPFNRFNASFLAEHKIPTTIVEYVQTAFSLNTPYRFQQNQPYLPQNYSTLATKLDEILHDMGNKSFLDLINEASFTCESLVEYCITPRGMLDCCRDATSVITPVGKCYRLRGPEQISSGFGFGMTVVLNVPDDKYLSPGKNNLHNDGVSIKLAEKMKGLDFDLTFIPAGVHALMPLRATKYDFINDPPRYECLEQVSDSYSSIRCFDDCFFQPGMQACECSHVTSSNRKYPACKPDELFTCLISKTLKVIRNSRDYVRKCHSLCKPACSFWQFHPTVSYAKFPSSTFYQYVPHTKRSRWKKTIILDVFYEKLEYTWIKHYPSMTLDTFVANIGGQVGLWVGGSILSLAQLIIFAIHYCCSSVWSRPKNKKDNLQRQENNHLKSKAQRSDSVSSGRLQGQSSVSEVLPTTVPGYFQANYQTAFTDPDLNNGDLRSRYFPDPNDSCLDPRWECPDEILEARV